MKKIMFVIGGLSNGGAERVITSVSSALAEKGYEVILLTYYKDDNEYSFSNKIKRINLSNGYFKDYVGMNFLKKVKNFRKIIKNEKPDEIICFLSHSYVLSYISSIFTKYKKRISLAIRANPKVEKGKVASLCMKLSKKAKRIITQNNGQATCFSNKMQSKIRVIPNPMYKELFVKEKQYSDTPTKIVSVGRLSDQKNYDLSIDAFAKLHKTYPNLTYYIYGKGDKENYLKEKIKKLNLQNFVFLKGFENDRNIIYGDKDIYLMTSKFEGMPNTLAEAMCFGVPSISTNCEFGPSDLIMNEDMGILLNDYNVETVVSKVSKVIESYNEYVIKAKNARLILQEEYGFEKIINKWISLIDEK